MFLEFRLGLGFQFRVWAEALEDGAGKIELFCFKDLWGVGGF